MRDPLFEGNVVVWSNIIDGKVYAEEIKKQFDLAEFKKTKTLHPAITIVHDTMEEAKEAFDTMDCAMSHMEEHEILVDDYNGVLDAMRKLLYNDGGRVENDPTIQPVQARNSKKA